jgi:hypothetical protein
MKLKTIVMSAAAMLGLGLPSMALGQNNLPPTQVYARAYGQWNIIGQQANTYTFNGGTCNSTAFNNGLASPTFVFSGSQAGSAVYFPVYIEDANPALSEVVTPSSTINTAATCGFSASTTNQHVSFTLLDGSGGLAPAVAYQLQSPQPMQVVLEKAWYTSIYGLPTQPLPETVIKAVTGNSNVTIVDQTTSPYTFWRWSGTAYAAQSLSGGASAPTAAAGAAAGTSPTGPTNTGDGNQFSVALTTGTATTTGVLFTETWATTGAFTYPPSCYVWSPAGTTNDPSFTYAITYTSSAAKITVSKAVAPTASTAYAYRVSCS